MHTIKSVLIFFGTLVVSYIIISLGIWVYAVNNPNSLDQVELKGYISKHKDELKNIVFNKIYLEADSCNKLSSDLLKVSCQKDVTHQLAIVIKEEDFIYPAGPTYPGGVDWPTDLYFIKQVGTNFYGLGWDGKLEDVSSRINFQKLNMPYFSRYLSGNCQIIDKPVNNTNSCQTYVTIDLGNGETGYIFRMIGLGDSDNIGFNLIFSNFIVFQSLLNPHFNAGADITFTGLIIIYLFLPLFLAILVIRFHSKKR